MSSPSLKSVSLVSSPSGPVLYRIYGPYNVDYTTEETPITVSMLERGFIATLSSTDILINYPYIAYRPLFWNVANQEATNSNEFGDSTKVAITRRYTKFFTKDDDSSEDAYLWDLSQLTYSSPLGDGGVFEWSFGAEWLYYEYVVQRVVDLYKYYAFQRILINVSLPMIASILSVGDIIVLNGLPGHLLPTSMGGDAKDMKFQIYEISVDYFDQIVKIKAIDVIGTRSW